MYNADGVTKVYGCHFYPAICVEYNRTRQLSVMWTSDKSIDSAFVQVNDFIWNSSDVISANLISIIRSTEKTSSQGQIIA